MQILPVPVAVRAYRTAFLMAGLYVHIPFCHSKCAYCDFYSVANHSRMKEVTRRIIKEFNTRRNEVGGIRTLYFGGGTPSILPLDLFRSLAECLREDSISEFTIEVNPEDVTAEAVDAWTSAGVNRVSMGVQSFNAGELKAVRRRHTPDDAVRAYEIFRSGGIANISLDLIYGLPGQDFQSWKSSLDKLLAMRPEHFSAYCLSYEPGTLLYRRLERGETRQADDGLVEEMYIYLCSAAKRAGYGHYEISNFALPGRHSRHNSSYWDGTPYLGLGPGAHSCDNQGVRRINPADILTYLNSNPAFIIEDENRDERVNDEIITGLRTARGLDLQKIDTDYCDEILANAATHLRCGNLVLDDSRLYIPERHWLIADAIMRDVII